MKYSDEQILEAFNKIAAVSQKQITKRRERLHKMDLSGSGAYTGSGLTLAALANRAGIRHGKKLGLGLAAAGIGTGVLSHYMTKKKKGPYSDKRLRKSLAREALIKNYTKSK
jgi:hypothetical protein